jgi:hypothetical protein
MTRPFTRLASICASAVLVWLTACYAEPAQTGQTALPVQDARSFHNPHTGKKSTKPEASQQELFDYVRGQLIALSPSDGLNDNLEVAFDPATSVLSVTQPDGRCDIFLSAIDSNSVIWQVIDPSEPYHTRDKVLRVTLTSLSGQKARTCYDSHNQVDTSMAGNHARLLFSQSKSSAVPDFTDTMGKAIKKLVVLAGGNGEKQIF